MRERENLVYELRTLVLTAEQGSAYDLIADFILSDRKRIVEPLVKSLEKCEKSVDAFEEHDIINRGIYETLRNAGIDKA